MLHFFILSRSAICKMERFQIFAETVSSEIQVKSKLACNKRATYKGLLVKGRLRGFVQKFLLWMTLNVHRNFRY